VVDLITSTLTGSNPPKIQRPAARRLNTKLPGVAEKYIKIYEANARLNRLVERLGKAHKNSKSKAGIRHKVEEIDLEAGQLMSNASRKCRKFKSGRICFCPELVLWIKMKQIYQSLLEHLRGRPKNRGNLKHAARKRQIRTPFQLSGQKIRSCLTICESQIAYFREFGERYRKKHLLNRVDAAQQAGSDKAARQILNIIAREKQRTFWRRLKFACGKKNGGSPSTVQVKGLNVEEIEYTTQEGVQSAIFENIHQKRFYLAEEAPICNNYLREEFGYNATSSTAQAVLNSTHNYPEDFDKATKELCEECARIRLKVPKNSVRSHMDCKDWRDHWRG
jgi:hypothetical protein